LSVVSNSQNEVNKMSSNSGALTAKRQRGQGSIIKRAGTENLYIRYWKDGRQIQEATGLSDTPENRKTAEGTLQDRMSDGRRGAVAQQDIKQLRYEDIRDSYFKVKPAQKNYPGMQHLDSFFKNRRVTNITTDSIEEFIEHRRDEDEVSDPTIRRNLVALRAMFRLAAKKGQLGLRDVPYFPMPEDSEAAGQYMEPQDFSKILKFLPMNLQPFFEFMYGTGCRLGALQKITWDMVNKDGDVITLPGSITKNKKPLTIVLAGQMLAPMAKMLQKMFRDADKPQVFDDTNYRPEWNKACAKAGFRKYDEETRRREEISGWRIHDCRCSAGINLLDAGVNEGLVLAIGGWKTRAMLDRYNRPNVNRIRAAMEQGGEYVAAKMKTAK
jgi:integrase